jgi:hypothetical protein
LSGEYGFSLFPNRRNIMMATALIVAIAVFLGTMLMVMGMAAEK